jgi:hypothetical protein
MYRVTKPDTVQCVTYLTWFDQSGYALTCGDYGIEARFLLKAGYRLHAARKFPGPL